MDARKIVTFLKVLRFQFSARPIKEQDSGFRLVAYTPYFHHVTQKYR